MGEYAKRRSDGQRVKIGTCEDMYYLRADQRDQVEYDEWDGCRFRFPWPDEDGTEPGAYGNDYDRALTVNVPMPAGVDHGTVQLSGHGYLLSIPCPEGTPDARIHRNGFSGAVQLVQHRLLPDGRLVPVLCCGGCGAKWRAEHPSDIEAVAVAVRSEADRRERDGRHNGTGAEDRRWYDGVADRLLALVEGSAV